MIFLLKAPRLHWSQYFLLPLILLISPLCVASEITKEARVSQADTPSLQEHPLRIPYRELKKRYVHTLVCYWFRTDRGRKHSFLEDLSELVADYTPYYDDMLFGPADWARYFGDVGRVPPLPQEIGCILALPCPFWVGKTIGETHLLTLIPATVGGKRLTLDLLGELIQRPQGGGQKMLYEYYDADVKKEHGAKGVGSPYWLLMTKDVLPGSRNQTYAAQQALVARHAQASGRPYQLPCALEAAISVLMYHAKHGERLYTDNPWTFTRCQELVIGNYPVVVGGFGSAGLAVSFSCDGDFVNYGVGGGWKL